MTACGIPRCLSRGAGALGVRLGDPVERGAGLVDRPALGVGEPAREDTD